MGISDHSIAAIRYGYGLPYAGSATAAGLLEQLSGDDPLLAKGAAYSTKEAFVVMRNFRNARGFRKSKIAAEREEFKIARSVARETLDLGIRTHLARAVGVQDGFRERLVHFWADHFTVSGKNRQLALLLPPYWDEAIRPHMTGRFGDLLTAAVTHPAMLIYLDQVASAGPASLLASRRKVGLNENLARELLELHTLGVSSAYSQKDVRQVAELLAGLRVRRDAPFYDASRSEPGAERILGKVYGDGPPKLRHILDFLQDIAVHPDTARHVARKLVVHFVSDDPDPVLVDHVTQAFLASGGDLTLTYTALLDHPAAWAGFGSKVKPPFEYVVSGYRALGATSDDILALPRDRMYSQILVPLQLMGQPLGRPKGPDGWSEEAEDWITPQGLAGRVQWAVTAAGQFGRGLEPKDFVARALDDVATAKTKWASVRAEDRTEGLALILASPEFNRR